MKGKRDREREEGEEGGKRKRNERGMEGKERGKGKRERGRDGRR